MWSFYILDVKMAVHKLKPICCGHIALQFSSVYPVDALFMSSEKTVSYQKLPTQSISLSSESPHGSVCLVMYVSIVILLKKKQLRLFK